MSTVYPSARGQKQAEKDNRPIGTNTIVTIWKSGLFVYREWGPAYKSAANKLHIELALDLTLTMGRQPLLWTYSKPDDNYTEVKFGFDNEVKVNKKDGSSGHVKIGHVALASEATISGEIYRSGAAWKINNDSGAWGNMGGHSGKTKMLLEAASFMTRHCGGMQVTADRAYSRYLVKRKIQQLFR